MKTKLALVALTALMFGSGGAASLRVHPRPGPAPLPPAPPPPPVAVVQPMSYGEAVNASLSYANQRGFNATVKDAKLTGNDVWKVKLYVSRGPRRGDMKLRFDAYSRSLLDVDENLKGNKHGHGKHDHDDDDEHEGHRASAVDPRDRVIVRR